MFMAAVGAFELPAVVGRLRFGGQKIVEDAVHRDDGVKEGVRTITAPQHPIRHILLSDANGCSKGGRWSYDSADTHSANTEPRGSQGQSRLVQCDKIDRV